MRNDPGLFGPDTVTWRLHADPVFGVAGLRALLLQALHPVAMAGVAQNSAFREDPWGRLLRTAEYVGTVTYGTTAAADAAAARVRGIHRRIKGTDPVTGRSYRAGDSDLLLWVHACLVDSFLQVVRRAGGPLDDEQADAYVAEQSVLAELVGVPLDLVPMSAGELNDYLTGVRPVLRVTEAAREAARLVVLPPMPLPVQVATPARPAWASVAMLAYGALPRWAREEFALPVPVLPELATTVALRSLRTALLAVPPALRDGPQLKAARARLAPVPA